MLHPIAGLIADLAYLDRLERAVVALVLGCGLRPGEVCRLRRGGLIQVRFPIPGHIIDIAPYELAVVVRSDRRPKEVRVIIVPRWAEDLIRAAGLLEISDASAPLLPTPGGVPRRSLQPIMQTIVRRLGRVAESVWTWSDLRGIWQARAAALRLGRSVQRGSWWAANDDGLLKDIRLLQTRELAAGWVALADPPAGMRRHPSDLKRHAPSHRDALEAEQKEPWCPPPLPASVTATGQVVGVTRSSPSRG